MAWRRAGSGARLYAGGETHALPVRDPPTIPAAPSFDGRAYAALSDRGRDAVYELLPGGPYHLAEPDGNAALTHTRRTRLSGWIGSLSQRSEARLVEEEWVRAWSESGWE